MIFASFHPIFNISIFITRLIKSNLINLILINYFTLI